MVRQNQDMAQEWFNRTVESSDVEIKIGEGSLPKMWLPACWGRTWDSRNILYQICTGCGILHCLCMFLCTCLSCPSTSWLKAKDKEEAELMLKESQGPISSYCKRRVVGEIKKACGEAAVTRRPLNLVGHQSLSLLPPLVSPVTNPKVSDRGSTRQLPLGEERTTFSSGFHLLM